MEARQDQEVALEKMVSIYTSRDPEVEDPLEEAMSTLEQMSPYDSELKLSGWEMERVMGSDGYTYFW